MVEKLSIKINDILDFDMSQISGKITDKGYAGYVSQRTGEHYRLLSYLSSIMNGEMFLDLGTYKGYSAICLAANENNHVKTFDISDYRNKEDMSHYPNIEFFNKDVKDIDNETILCSSVILLDIVHNGLEETKFIDRIFGLGYEGLIIVDDIYFNSEMIDFWINSTCPDTHTKFDFTEYFHATGTGVYCPNNIEFLEKE